MEEDKFEDDHDFEDDEDDENFDEDEEEAYDLILNQIEQIKKNMATEISENKTSISISRLSTDETSMIGCDYCKPLNLKRDATERTHE